MKILSKASASIIGLALCATPVAAIAAQSSYAGPSFVQSANMRGSDRLLEEASPFLFLVLGFGAGYAASEIIDGGSNNDRSPS